MNIERRIEPAPAARAKFQHPDWTAHGEPRARVALDRLDTLWINTGTRCNITCRNCYIESAPDNDRLAYISAAEVTELLDEIAEQDLGTRQIGFTGGEPFLNPEALAMIGAALERGFEVLVLTNAMRPMQRPRVRNGLVDLKQLYGPRLRIRVSLDHWSRILHESERGARTWAATIAGLDWLSENGFSIAIAARTCWGEGEAETRAGFAALITEHGWPIDAMNASQLVLFPEMDASVDVPEITERCWSLLGKSPREVMCATSRMVVKRRGEARPTVLPCTLLPYDRAFDMGATLAEAAKAHGGMFANGAVKLCHPHCAKFCVLGGGSCAAE